MRSRSRANLRFLAIFVLLGGLGIIATAYLLSMERLALPFQSFYRVNARFTEANGLVAGLGQPVTVAGVNVGEVTGVKLVDGVAQATLQIQHSQVPRVYANATAVLQPITPLGDLEINLQPGSPPAARLYHGATIGVGATTSPVPLSDLLSSLDGDTRTFLSSLIGSLAQGTAGRGPAIRGMLRALGPTVQEVGAISHQIARRNTDLAQLVHNIGTVATAASQDRRLASVVVAGNQTLHAIAAQDAPLKEAIAQFPSTFTLARTALTRIEPFAQQLAPTLHSLLPAAARLPATLTALRPFAASAAHALQHDIEPFVRAAEPVVKPLVSTTPTLVSTTPKLSQSFQVLQYLTNELAYDPQPGGTDQGFLFWASWAMHNFDSIISVGDANGGIGRAEVLLNCGGLQYVPTIQQALGVAGLCQQ
ncbi:MAG TPA: MlaD family protein [Solirubrobacteraceae bacterium]|nr:MlaD family protein [Solirubrobacteraceae bacterium]